MGTHHTTVRFSEASEALDCPTGDSLLQLAQQNGVDITATCGGRGRCRSCRIKLVEGNLPEPTVADRAQLSGEEIRERYRLSCQCLLTSDATVSIAPPINETSFQILSETGERDEGHVWKLDSGITKTYLHPERPSTESQKTSESEVLLGASESGNGLDIGLDTVRRIPEMLDDISGGVTVTRFRGQILSIEAGDTSPQSFGLAFDIGTTTVVAYLINLITGETVSSVSGLNPQTVFGGDLISRITFAAEQPSNVQKLHSRIIAYLNDLSKQACQLAGVECDHVYKAVIVGNTCMHHLLLGIDPTSVGKAPYLPIIRHSYACSAREAGLRLNRGARLFMLPLVAGFVGADTVGMILSTGIDDKPGICIAADIGTNAEVVLSGPDGIIACSSPAGPALEGGQIHDGMRAALGAIDKVSIDEDIRIHTIGDVPALGICGSGLIDAVAALLDVGIIAPSGRMVLEPEKQLPEPLVGRLRLGADDRPEFVLVWADSSANRTDIVLSQGDIRELQLAKAAIISGVEALVVQAGVATDDIAEFMLAGGFGNYLNIHSARRIGLIPDIPADRIRYVANAAGSGAQMALLSETERDRADALAESVTHISLAGYPEFQKMYLGAMGFPKMIR